MPNRPTTAPGERIYAIGDVHGRLDLLGELLETIRVDGAARAHARSTVIQVGDLIDRGPSSAQLVREFMKFTMMSARVLVLKGNHEAAMVEALSGNLRTMGFWLEMGGDATLASWDVDRELIAARQLPEVLRAARKAIPRDVLEWLDRLPLWYASGDYFFVHAGVRPGVALASQDGDDLLWIGEEFTESGDDHGAVVVHGHSISDDGPVFRANRIGIDTGAYRTGQLTALGVDGGERWTLSTRRAS